MSGSKIVTYLLFVVILGVCRYDLKHYLDMLQTQLLFLVPEKSTAESYDIFTQQLKD